MPLVILTIILAACHPSPPKTNKGVASPFLVQAEKGSHSPPTSHPDSASRQKNAPLILATTTSVQDCGLLDLLVPLFEAQSGYLVKTVAVGSGQALQMGADGNADVLLVHDPTAELQFMAEGYGKDRVPVMHNNFLLVGPPEDPAQAKAKPILEALQAIANTQAYFISRGDDSGTYQVEMSLWKTIGYNPQGQSWYIETGQGMGASLIIASEKRGYLLADQATFLSYQDKLNLEPIVEGTQALQNIYHVITVNPQVFPRANYEAALAFVQFLTAPETQKHIGEFGVQKYGKPLFFPAADLGFGE